jgi:hypothetical protein
MFEALFLMSAMGISQCCGSDPGYYPPVYYSQPVYHSYYFQPVQQVQSTESPQYHMTKNVSGDVAYTTHDISDSSKTFYAWCRYPVGVRYVPIVSGYVPEYSEYGVNGVTTPYYDFSRKIRYDSLRTAVDGRRPTTTETSAKNSNEPVINHGRLPNDPKTTNNQDIDKIIQRFDKIEKDLAETKADMRRILTSQAKTVPFIEDGSKTVQPKENTVPDGMKRPSEVDPK